MHIYIHTYMHIYISSYIHTYVHTYIYTYIGIHIRIRIGIPYVLRIRTRIFIYIYRYIHSSRYQLKLFINLHLYLNRLHLHVSLPRSLLLHLGMSLSRVHLRTPQQYTPKVHPAHLPLTRACACKDARRFTQARKTAAPHTHTPTQQHTHTPTCPSEGRLEPRKTFPSSNKLLTYHPCAPRTAHPDRVHQKAPPRSNPPTVSFQKDALQVNLNVMPKAGLSLFSRIFFVLYRRIFAPAIIWESNHTAYCIPYMMWAPFRSKST